MSEIELDYLEETGPGIPELPAGEAIAPPDLEAPAVDGGYPGWDPEAIAQFLRGMGAGVHMLVGQSERDWLMLEADLNRIGPPLTRIANRWEPALRLSPLADPLLVAHGFALWGWRSALERQRALRDTAEEQTEEPVARYQHAGPESDVASFAAAELDDEQDAPYFPDSPRARSET